jgi:hypothetical protein
LGISSRLNYGDCERTLIRDSPADDKRRLGRFVSEGSLNEGEIEGGRCGAASAKLKPTYTSLSFQTFSTPLCSQNSEKPVRDQGVGGSNPLSPTNLFNELHTYISPAVIPMDRLESDTNDVTLFWECP